MALADVLEKRRQRTLTGLGMCSAETNIGLIYQKPSSGPRGPIKLVHKYHSNLYQHNTETDQQMMSRINIPIAFFSSFND